jgi:hypothetical protein
MNAELAAEGRQRGVDPMKLLGDGLAHHDVAEMGDGVGGHGNLVVRGFASATLP